MRKLFLVFLVLLAAAALGFAQDAAGTVTWTGEVKIGAKADFTKTSTQEDPIVKPDSDRYGQVVFSYDKGALNTEVQGRVAYDEEASSLFKGHIGLVGEYGDGVNGDTENPYKVAANVRFFTDSSTDFAIEKLYGYYLFLDKQLKLDVAYKGYETRYWRVSDIVADDWDNLDGKIGMALKFAPSAVNGLSAGIAYSEISSGTITALRSESRKFEDVLLSTVIGAKYEVSPIAVSFMIQLDHDRDKEETISGGTVTYTKEGAFRGNLGFKYQISDALHAQTDWQLAMTGKYKDWDDDSNKSYAYLRGGARVEYNSAPLHAGLNIKLNDGGDINKLSNLEGDGGMWFDSDQAKLHHSYFVLNPYVYYDLILDTLQVRLPIQLGLDIAPETDVHKSGYGSGFIVEPGLYWNLKRDGAKDDPSRGIRLKYRLGFAFDEDNANLYDDRGDFINELNLLFCWDF